MKQAVQWMVLFSAALSVQGCPIFDDDEECVLDADCGPGFSCDRPTGLCLVDEDISSSCDRPSACADGLTCGADGRCLEGSCRFSSVGCVEGFACEIADGTWGCVREGSAGGAGGEGGGAGEGAFAGSAGFGQGEGGFAGLSGEAGEAGEAGGSQGGMSQGGLPGSSGEGGTLLAGASGESGAAGAEAAGAAGQAGAP